MMSESDEFGFNARQYFDFSKGNDDLNDDSYFEIAHENTGTESRDFSAPQAMAEVIERVELSDTESDAAFFSPLGYTGNAGVSSATIYLNQETTVRRSLSLTELSCDPLLLESTEESHINEPKRPNSACALNPKKKWMSKEHIDRLAQPKTTDKGHFMSLAEEVNKFQVATPTRFRSRSAQRQNKVKGPTACTKPSSPKLTTAQRARPLAVTTLSREERERLEMEEAKKFKIRARPVNKKALKGPLKPQIERKPPTTIEPFDLTEVKKKDPVEDKAPVFKAQPLPKSLYKPFKVQESTHTITKPQSPNIKKVPPKYTPKKEQRSRSCNSETGSKLTVTRPIPFSFEKRHQDLLKKKEERINKVLEEEKKAREFHAKPPPKAILRARNCSADRASSVSKSSMGSNDEVDMTFKARPASVLTMKPFVPRKDDSHVLVAEAFHFSTDERLEARHKFEEQLKEKEQMLAMFEKKREEMRKKKEEEEVARLRKLAEHKAQPIRKYKEVVIKPSNKVTEPISPMFHTDRIRNKENIAE